MGQLSFEVKLTISRAKAWEKLRDLAAARHYVPGVTAIEYTSEEHEGVGASRKVFSAGRSPVDETVISWDEGRGYTLKIHKGDQPPFPFKWGTFQYQLMDTLGGWVVVRGTFSYDVPWGAFGRLLDAVVLRPTVERVNAALAANMKSFFETGRSAQSVAAA